ncbi:hypothetical protein D3C84_793390 [compost metagenome]
MGPDDQWIVATVMADQHRYAARLGGSHQLSSFIKVHTHRFFQQHRHASRETIERSADVQCVGVGDDDRVWLRLLQHLTVIGEVTYPPLNRQAGRLRTGIRHGAQGRFSQGLQMLVMLLAHIASADQCDSKGPIQDAVLLGFLLEKRIPLI